MSELGIIILAAGESKRMGFPKLKLELDGKSLLDYVLDITSSLKEVETVLVLGAYMKLYNNIAGKWPVNKVFNKEWQSGMGVSIVTGLHFLLNKSETAINSVMILLADQPFVTKAYLEKMILKSNTTNIGIIISDYGSVSGPPVIFKSPYFDKLLELKGDQGAKHLIAHHQNDCEAMSFPEGKYDVNTPEDHNRLIRRKSR